MRRFLTLVLLTVVLLALVWVSNALTSLHFVVEGSPQQTLYLATFDDASDWQVYSGRLSAQVADGVMRVENGDVDRFAFSVARPHFADFDLQVQAQAVSGPENNGYGVVFRYRNPQNFLMFLISSDGYYRVSRVVEGDQRVLSEWIDSPLILPGFGAANTIRVQAVGDQYTFFINGTQTQLCIPNDPNALSTYRTGLGCIGGTMQDRLTDSSFTTGQVGVVALSLSEPDVIAQFDNLVVYSPELSS